MSGFLESICSICRMAGARSSTKTPRIVGIAVFLNVPNKRFAARLLISMLRTRSHDAPRAIASRRDMSVVMVREPI